jgi:hypothetical protein
MGENKVRVGGYKLENRCAIEQIINAGDASKLHASCSKQNSCRFEMLKAMRADRVEVSWDQAKSKWLVRIEVGEEVIRRYSNEARDADELRLRAAAEKTATEEGYKVESANVVIAR